MPTIAAGNLEINYQIQGAGEPLLLIMGLSFSLRDWGTILPDRLAQHYRVILFDNRDAGETTKVGKPYSTATMAADALALLKALEIEKAHVMGISMGGMIAQELALHYPDRLDRLILGGTMAGGDCSEWGEVQAFLLFKRLELLFTPSFYEANRSSIDAFFQSNQPYRSRGTALARQLAAMSGHDTCDRLSQITAPTLVLGGDSDRLMPVQNSRFLAQGLPHAQLEILPDAGHGFCYSHPEETAARVLEFLR